MESNQLSFSGIASDFFDGKAVFAEIAQENEKHVTTEAQSKENETAGPEQAETEAGPTPTPAAAPEGPKKPGDAVFKEVFDPALIIILADMVLSRALMFVFRAWLKYDCNAEDFELSKSERESVNALAREYVKTMEVKALSPGWMLTLGITSIYSAKSIAVLAMGQKITKPGAPRQAITSAAPGAKIPVPKKSGRPRGRPRKNIAV
jgi:hypothetical protein